MINQVSWYHVRQKAAAVAKLYEASPEINIYGVPRGGVIPAALVSSYLPKSALVESPKEARLIVDDITDSGATRARYRQQFPAADFVSLFHRMNGPFIEFPWERMVQEAPAEDMVLRLLQYIGEDPAREGLRETPKRFLAAWDEWAKGYKTNPLDVIKTFAEDAHRVDEMIVVDNIPVRSKCEHHLADITGVAHVGYIPNGRIVGLSKIPRIVEIFSRRLQVQERLTNDIADALCEVLKPKGVGVVIRASHACMSTRGVNIQDSFTSTSAMRGVFRDFTQARSEFFSIIQNKAGK